MVERGFMPQLEQDLHHPPNDPACAQRVPHTPAWSQRLGQRTWGIAQALCDQGRQAFQIRR